MGALARKLEGAALAALLFAAATFSPNAALAQGADFVCADQQDVSPALIAQAQQRLQGSDSASLADAQTADTVYPAGDALGLTTTGKARAVVVRVSFPASDDGTELAQTIPASETDDDLLSIFNGEQNSDSPCYPYESVHAYYERSSLGKLDYQATQVVDYTAKYPRSHYEALDGDNELFAEAAAGVDDKVDFTECDANGDGYIDAFYLQFAGPTGAWGSRWWPQRFVVSADSTYGQQSFDGKHLHSAVLFCTPSGGSYDATTFRSMIVHETGHVLGLPDLYSQTEPKGPGTGTFDMMDTNEGEQNGLFRWLLGWVSTDDITFVRVTTSGIYVRKGSGDVVRYDGAATVDLASYTSDIAGETGGFVAISADETILSGNLFCSFYLLQFDSAVGNQKISKDGQLLGYGVRAFRVQASLNDDKDDFAAQNKNGVKGNQLYEILDPQDGGAAYEFGSFMHTGQVVSPTTDPSSNFKGSLQAGYSGITFEVTNETEASARVKVSWTANTSAGEELTFAPASSNRALNGSNNLSFTASFTVTQNTDCGDDIYLSIDGKKTAVASLYNDASGELSVTARLNPGDLAADATAELVIPAGYFNMGLDAEGNTRLSDEIRVPLAVAAMQTIDASGDYEATTVSSKTTRTYSDVARDSEGCAYFFQAGSVYETGQKTLSLVRVSKDGSKASSIDIDTSAAIWPACGASLQVVDLGDGTVYLRSTDPSGTLEAHDAWVDLATGKVLSTYDSGQPGEDVLPFSLGGNAALAVHTRTGTGSVMVLKRNGSSVECSCIDFKDETAGGFDTVGNAGNDYAWSATTIAISSSSFGTQLALYGAGDVLAADNGANVAPSAALKLSGVSRVYDAKVKNGKVYVAAKIDDSTSSSGSKQQLLVYSLDGELLSATDVTTVSDTYARISVSDNGSVAWSTYAAEYQSLAGDCNTGQVVFVDDATHETTELGVMGIPGGVWLDDAWLEIGPQAQVGAVSEECMHWSRTAAIGKSGSSEPDPEPEPEPEPEPNPTSDDGSSNETSDSSDGTTKTSVTTVANAKSTLPKTGDDACFVALSAFLAGAAALACARRFGRRFTH